MYPLFVLTMQVEALKNENIGQVAAGGEFSLALTLDRHHLYSFGRGDYGQLGVGQLISTITDPAFINTPQIVRFPKAVKILEINAGDKHVMVITEEHELYTWGLGAEGATGFVDPELDIVRPRKLDLMAHVESDSISHCHAVAASGGGAHSLLLAKFFRKTA
jgi:Regulator of chromosome condensation (RCC1) repeat